MLRYERWAARGLLLVILRLYSLYSLLDLIGRLNVIFIHYKESLLQRQLQLIH